MHSRIRQFAEKTTVNGIKDFLHIEYIWARCLWAILLISCFTMMIYETYALLNQYAEEPTATRVRQEYLPSYPYPKMIFCPKQWINTTKVTQLNLPKPYLIYALSLLRRVNLDKKDKEEIGANVDWLRPAFDQFLQKHQFTDYLNFFSTIANDPFSVANCDQCEIRMNQVIASGVCIQFKPFPATSDHLIKLTPTFRYRDLNLNLNSSNDRTDLIPFYSSYLDADSIYVSFRPQFDFFTYDPILLNRNNSYVLRIKPTNYQRLNKPDRPCAETVKVKNERYSQVMCYFYCDERYKSICRGCNYLTYLFDEFSNFEGDIDFDSDINNRTEFEFNFENSRSNTPYCSSLVQDPINIDSCNKINDDEFTKCIKSCQPLCNEWVYETTAIPVAQRKLITSHDEADITVTISYQVRYGETFIEEVQTYSWDTFVSNIGGQLGLWMGVSVVSLLQLLHFLVEFCYYEMNPCHRMIPSPNSTGTITRRIGSTKDRSAERSGSISIYTLWPGIYNWTPPRLACDQHQIGHGTVEGKGIFKRAATYAGGNSNQNGASMTGDRL